MTLEGAPTQPLDRVGRLTWWSVVLGSAVILALRVPGAVLNPQLWAEEGIFYHQAYTIGLPALFVELAGYLHLVPRLIAALSVALDPAWVPALFIWIPFALTVLVVSRVLSPRCPLPSRALCALAIVLVPDAAEVLLTTVNIQWILAIGLFLLVLSADPTSPRQYVYDLVASVVFGLTGPFSIVLTPLFIWRAATRRTKASLALALLVTGCAVCQSIVIWHHPQPPPPDPQLDTPAILSVSGIRIGGSLLLGWLLKAPVALVWGVVLTVITLVGTALLALLPGQVRTVRILAGLAFAALLASALFRYRYLLPALCVPGNGSRYFFPPQILLLWLVFAAMGRGKIWARTITVVLVWCLLVNFTRMRSDPMTDQHWENFVPKIRAGEAVTVIVNPGWEIPLPAKPPKKP